MSRFGKDRTWIRQSMILPSTKIDQTDMSRRLFSDGMFDFADTTLGGNQAINPLPQYCEFADLNTERFFPNVGRGMGSQYSDMVNSNQVLVHLRCGVPAFNSLTMFLANSYSPDASRLARTGRTGGVGFFIGRVIGFAVSLRMLPLILIGQSIRFLMQKPSTRFYYLKPAMPLFFNALNNLVNAHCANTGFVSALHPEQYGDELASGLSEADKRERGRLLPDIYGKNGEVDIYAVATRYQRLSNQRLEKIYAIRDESANLPEAKDRYKKFLQAPLLEQQGRPLAEYLNAYLNQPATQPLPSQQRTVESSTPPTEGQGGGSGTTFLSEVSESFSSLFEEKGGAGASFGDFLVAELRDGAQFISFRVDDPGSVSESFSNQTKESELSGMVNGMSNAARSAKFTFANGNVSDGLIGQTVGAIATFAGDILSGAAHQLGVSGLAALAGNALVDIPKHWDGSTADLPKMSYTIKLRSIYGNEFSRFQSLMVPLYALLAAALPLSTGTQSYTSPFLVEAYCQGRAQTRLGMIDSLQITRGTSGVGFTKDGKPLGIDISFSIVDLSSVMHMPITSQFNPLDYLTPGGLSKMFTSDDSAIGDYQAVLAGLSLTDQIYPIRKLKRNWYKNQLDFNSYFSRSHMANWIGGWTSARMLSGLWNATDRGNPAA